MNSNDVTSFVNWMNDNHLIEPMQSGFLRKVGMDVKKTADAIALFVDYLADGEELRLGYAGNLRSRNHYEPSVMLFTNYRFIFIHYEKPTQPLIFAYVRSDLTDVIGVESAENRFMYDLCIRTDAYGDPGCLYGVHNAIAAGLKKEPVPQQKLKNTFIDLINDMVPINGQSGLLYKG